MKKVFIRYNPYKPKTEITVDGENIKERNSSIRVKSEGASRLQEWVEELPRMLIDQFAQNIEIEFHGTAPDYEDLLDAVEKAKGQKWMKGLSIKAKERIPAKEITDIEALIGKIFKEILAGPFDELRDQSINDSFKHAMSGDVERYAQIANIKEFVDTLTKKLKEIDDFKKLKEGTEIKALIEKISEIILAGPFDEHLKSIHDEFKQDMSGDAERSVQIANIKKFVDTLKEYKKEIDDTLKKHKEKNYDSKLNNIIMVLKVLLIIANALSNANKPTMNGNVEKSEQLTTDAPKQAMSATVEQFELLIANINNLVDTSIKNFEENDNRLKKIKGKHAGSIGGSEEIGKRIDAIQEEINSIEEARKFKERGVEAIYQNKEEALKKIEEIRLKYRERVTARISEVCGEDKVTREKAKGIVDWLVYYIYALEQELSRDILGTGIYSVLSDICKGMFDLLNVEDSERRRLPSVYLGFGYRKFFKDEKNRLDEEKNRAGGQIYVPIKGRKIAEWMGRWLSVPKTSAGNETVESLWENPSPKIGKYIGVDKLTRLYFTPIEECLRELCDVHEKYAIERAEVRANKFKLRSEPFESQLNDDTFNNKLDDLKMEWLELIKKETESILEI